jgi:hypothetical protein
MIDIFGHLGYAMLISGTWLVGKKKRVGWLLRLGGSTTWMVLGFCLGLSSIYLWSAGFMAVDVFGFQYSDKLAKLQEQADEL